MDFYRIRNTCSFLSSPCSSASIYSRRLAAVDEQTCITASGSSLWQLSIAAPDVVDDHARIDDLVRCPYTCENSTVVTREVLISGISSCPVEIMDVCEQFACTSRGELLRVSLPKDEDTAETSPSITGCVQWRRSDEIGIERGPSSVTVSPEGNLVGVSIWSEKAILYGNASESKPSGILHTSARPVTLAFCPVLSSHANLLVVGAGAKASCYDVREGRKVPVYDIGENPSALVTSLIGLDGGQGVFVATNGLSLSFYDFRSSAKCCEQTVYPVASGCRSFIRADMHHVYVAGKASEMAVWQRPAVSSPEGVWRKLAVSDSPWIGCTFWEGTSQLWGLSQQGTLHGIRFRYPKVLEEFPLFRPFQD